MGRAVPPPMKRRTVLSSAGGLALFALAGCLDRGGAGNDPYEEDDANLPDGVVDRTFEVVSVRGGSQTQEADVSFDNRVRISGTTTGNNGCYTARLKDVSFEGGELEVTVEAYEDKDDDQMCTQSLVEIEYEASFQFEGDLPDRVVVKHDSMGGVETVTEVNR